MEDKQKLLDAPIPWEEITYRRAGGNRWLAYVSGEYVKRELNRIFDGEWNLRVLTHKFDARTGVQVHVKLVIPDKDGSWIEREGLAYGTNSQGYDFAAASGVTDALKRAAATLGNRLGLQLYKQRSPAFQAAWQAIEGDTGETGDFDEPLINRINNSEKLDEYEKYFLNHFYQYIKEQK